MQLTIEQEEILIQMIGAFKNGKRLSDLPEVKGVNPCNLFVEVLDEDGKSKKAALSTLLPYTEEEVSYGIEFDTSVSSPSCLRIGNKYLHKVLPIQSRMKGCLLDDSGRIVEYLNHLDWTGNIRDGSRGQVMVEIPLHYRKFETDGTKRRVRLSELPLPGYNQVPKMYVSAYEASVQRSTKMLASVVNDSVDYRGGNNNSSLDGTYLSLLGRPATAISRTDFREYARKRKPETAEWNCMTYDIHKTLYWLFTVEYATLNSQADYNAMLTADGYRQGGLGGGVTIFRGEEWREYNNYCPFIPCGITDIVGNGTSTVAYTAYKENSDVLKTFSVPRYRGVENPFGHVWQWTDGINIRVSPDIDKGGDGFSRVFVCSDPAKFNDSNYTGYRHIGNAARINGLLEEIIFGEYGDIIASKGGGNNFTTYHCDYHYMVKADVETLTGAMFGGNAYSAYYAGLTSALLRHSPSYSTRHCGTRLCFVPKQN